MAQQQRSGVFQQTLPRQSGHYRTAAQQHQSQVGLQCGDLLGDRRLGVAELGGGGGEGTPVGDEHERAQQMRVHEASVSLIGPAVIIVGAYPGGRARIGA
ncbi:hypothetical protein GCM10009525_48430 [Streptosporangium amethystogenes subsp. fukuiense]